MRSALVVGGNGAVGRAVVARLAEGWDVTSVDVEANSDAQTNFQFDATLPFESQARTLVTQTRKKFHAIVCVAGGFESGQIDEPGIFEQTDRMLHSNLYPALFSAHVAALCLQDGGLLLLTGAATPFKSSAPGVLGYAIAKTAIHSLALNLATGVGLPGGVCVLTMLPETIDTPANRVGSPEADVSQWIDLDGIADLVRTWCDGRDRPPNGSFMLLRRAGDRLVFEFV